ncbi:MAG: reverse transcriptase family protein [Polyangiales bacterium]
MADDEKAKLYKRLVRDASDWQVLERMRVNGFWPWHKGIPEDPPAEAKERAKIDQELHTLRAQSSKSIDPDKALAEERKRRWDASKARRKEAKAKRAAEQKKRRDAYATYRKANVVHLGEGVSAGLQDVKSDTAELTKRHLPVLARSQDVAMVLGITLPQLRWLTYHRRGATVVHYHRYEIPKKTGGRRAISAPKKRLAAAQRWVFLNILNKLSIDARAHGFVRHRSIITNATPHVGKRVVVNLDLKDFFPSVTFRRVKGLFKKFGYSEHVATVLSLLCTEPPRVATTLDGKVYHVALGARVLPQGACTSPAITNLLCDRLDKRLAGLAKRHGFTYTRYADDLTLSGDKATAAGRILRSAREILKSEGFVENPAKTRVMRASQRQEVTGVTVNQRVTVPRDEYRLLRATLHNAAKHGLASQNREGVPNFAAHLKGRVEFACMVDPERAPKLRAALAAALAKG